jgi:hypothetical protein
MPSTWSASKKWFVAHAHVSTSSNVAARPFADDGAAAPCRSSASAGGKPAHVTTRQPGAVGGQFRLAAP